MLPVYVEKCLSFEATLPTHSTLCRWFPKLNFFYKDRLTPPTNQRRCISSRARPNGDTYSAVGHLVISFRATRPPAHPEYGDRVSSRNVGEPSHPDAAVCLKN